MRSFVESEHRLGDRAGWGETEFLPGNLLRMAGKLQFDRTAHMEVPLAIKTGGARSMEAHAGGSIGVPVRIAALLPPARLPFPPPNPVHLPTALLVGKFQGARPAEASARGM